MCDLDIGRAAKLAGSFSGVQATDNLQQVLEDPMVEAVAVATPAATHLEVAMAAIEAGKHVLVEKPLASSYADGRALVEAADERGVVLMCDHTYCYTPAVQRIRELLRSGVLGKLQFVDSVRIISDWCNGTSTCCGTSPHTICRFSILSCPKAALRWPSLRTVPIRLAPAKPASHT